MRIAKQLTLLIALIAAVDTYARQNAPKIVTAAVEKQKTRPFWFELNTIHLPYIPLAYQTTGTMTKFNSDGSVKGSSGATYEFTPAASYVTMAKMLEYDRRPPPPKAKEDFDSRFEKKWEDYKKKSEKEKERFQLAAERERTKRALFWNEFLRAYQFEIVGSQEVDGRRTQQFTYKPLPAYRPGNAEDAKYLPKLKGQIWIDETDGEIARLTLEFTQDVTGFVGVGKVYKGSRYTMDLAKQIDGIWLPQKAETYLAQRILLSKNRQTFTVEYRNYRKFDTDVKIQILK